MKRIVKLSLPCDKSVMTPSMRLSRARLSSGWHPTIPDCFLGPPTRAGLVGAFDIDADADVVVPGWILSVLGPVSRAGKFLSLEYCSGASAPNVHA